MLNYKVSQRFLQYEVCIAPNTDLSAIKDDLVRSCPHLFSTVCNLIDPVLTVQISQ